MCLSPRSSVPGNLTVSAKPIHWVVHMNHRNRAVSWLFAVAIFSVYFLEHGQAWTMWVAMGLQFLVYPHVVYWRARRATNPLLAEIQNMLFDSFCFGVWSALLGFPLWIMGLLVLCGCMNLAAFRGTVGIVQALVAAIGGAALVWALGAQAPFAPDTSLTVSLMSLLSLAIYLAMFGRSTHRRTVVLNDTRVKLRQSEQALQAQLEAVQSLQGKLTEQANRDPLTGLYNRRYLNDTLQREFDRCARDAAPVSVLLVDLDHFKQINDRFGHRMGDEVLCRVSELLLQRLRTSDLCCRYGGEEFLIFLPDVDVEVALERAEQWRQLIEAQHWEVDGQVFGVTLSIGVASHPTARTAPATLIELADQALYRAKTDGRNRICVTLPECLAAS